MSFLGARDHSALLKADFWAVTQWHRWRRHRGAGTIRGSFGLENQRTIICQGLGNDYTVAALSSTFLSFSLPALSLAFVKAGCPDACPTTWIVPADSLIRWYGRPLQADCKCFHVPAALHCAPSSEKNKWPCNETWCKMTHPLFQSGSEADWKRVTVQTKSALFLPPLPWNGLCQNTTENKAQRVVRVTVKRYGLDSNWQSGWARESRSSESCKSRAGGLCVCNCQAFVYSSVCVLTTDVYVGTDTQALSNIFSVCLFLCWQLWYRWMETLLDYSCVTLQDRWVLFVCIHIHKHTYCITISHLITVYALYVSTCTPHKKTVGWFGMKFCIDINGPHKMNSYDFV